jgi:AmpD protein
LTADYWLPEAVRQDSPNHSERPDPEDVSLLVIHNISLPPGQYGGPWIDRLFTNTLPADADPYFAEIAHLRVSAHLLIRRDGTTVQYVPFDRKAWHAGQSCYMGRDSCNDFSIGIELEGSDYEPFTDIQYTALTRVTRYLMDRYPAILPSRIVGHSDIAPARKTDPGPFFDWNRYREACL